MRTPLRASTCAGRAALVLLAALTMSNAALPQQEENRGVSIHDETRAVNPGRYIVSVVGIDNYANWPKLHNAVNDAIGFQETLVKEIGFSAPIPPLTDAKATKDSIMALVEDQLRRELQPDDNLIFFFAGHGHTRVDKIGGKSVETGFIVPVDSAYGKNEQWSDYIEIDELLKNIGKLPARHILVVLDSCFSGFALGGSAESFRSAARYQQDLAARVSRKVITSAHLDQLAQDSGSLPGHSLFTGTFIEGLNHGQLDLDQDGVVTSSEIGLGLQQLVGQSSQSRQTPDFGAFYLDDRGEMILPVKGGATPSARGMTPGTKEPPCYSIETAYPKVMPFSLKNSIEAQDFLYWFHIKVANHCGEPLHIRIGFKVRRGPAATPKEEVPAEYTVYPGTVLSQKVDPVLEFLSGDAEGTLEVIWGIRNETDTLLESGTARIELLPKNIFDWELTTPEGAPVSREFLIASLAAWIVTPVPKLKEYAAVLLKSVPSNADPSAYARDWFRQCYTDLVQSQKIKIRGLDAFPPVRQEPIQAPAELLEGGFADPIETALLLAALTQAAARKLDTETMSLVVAGQGATPRVFFGWRTGHDAWQAFDIAQAGSMAFEQNLSTSMQTLSETWKAHPEMVQSLDEKGVYIAKSSSTVALNFAKAAQQFHIQGLP